MELKIQELFQEAVQEENEFKRLKLLSIASRALSEQLPFQQLHVILQRQPDLMKYLFLANPLFGTTIEMIISAIMEKLGSHLDFIERFYQSAASASSLSDSFQTNNAGMRYCKEVYKNSFSIKKELLMYCRQFVDIIMVQHSKNQSAGHQVINFYKSFLTTNTRFDLLNICFKDAMEVRKLWKEVTFFDPYFEREIEESNQTNIYSKVLIRKNIDSKTAQAANDSHEKQILMDLLKQKKQQEGENDHEQAQNKLNKQDRIIRSLEEWLYHPGEFPVISNQSSSTTFLCDLFRNFEYYEILMAFLLNPLKYKLTIEYKQFNEQKLHCEDVYIPQFRKEWQKEDQIYEIDKLQRCKMSYRAMRTMQALTNVKNHFLLTQINSEYFMQACFFLCDQFLVSLIYENLKNSSSGFILSVNPIFHYLQFLLYYEPDISIYFILHYNLPFRFILYLEIPIVSQFLIQLFQNGSSYYRIPQEQLNMIWTYIELTDFFFELIKISQMLMNNTLIETITHYKALVGYKPKNMSDLIMRPDLTPLQNTKGLVQIEQRKLVEELDKTVKDVDLIQALLQKKQQRAASIFEKLIANSPRRKKSVRGEQFKVIEIAPNKSKFKKLEIEQKRNSGFKRRNFTKLLTTNFVSTNLDKTPVLEHQNSASSIIEETEISSPVKKLDSQKRKTIFRIIETAILNHNSSNQELTIQKKSQPVDSQKGLRSFRIKQSQRLSSLHIQQRTNMLMTPTPESSQLKISRTILSPKDSVLLNIQNVEPTRSDQTSLIKRFQYLIQEKKVPHSTSNSWHSSAIQFVDQNAYREQLLYPSNMRDFHQTEIELDGKKPDYSYEWLDQNERFSREAALIIFDVLQFQQSDPKKFKIIIQNTKEYLNILAKNYFLKLKIPEEELTCALISGRIYNQVLRFSQPEQLALCDGLIYEHFQFLCQLITSTFLLENQRKEPLLLQQNQIFYQMKMKTFVLIETLSLMVEVTNNKLKYLSCISTSLWHLLFIYLTEYRTNELYQQLFQKITSLAILYGNISILNRIVLRLNCFNHIKLILEEIYSNNILDKELYVDFLFQSVKQFSLLVYTIIKVKASEFNQLKQQLDIMSSWNYIKQAFKSSVRSIEKGDFDDVQRCLKNEEKAAFSRLIAGFMQNRNKKKN